MDKLKFVKRFFKKKEVLNLSYISIFLLIFTIFLFFAIRPAILSIVKLQKDIEELKLINENYNKQIDQILAIQTEYENNRDNIILINQAIPSIPRLSDLIKEIRNTADNIFFRLKEISVGKVNILDLNKSQNINNLSLLLKVNSNFSQIDNFIKKIYQQRRLKYIKKISIQKDIQETTDSGQLNITLEVDSFFY